MKKETRLRGDAGLPPLAALGHLRRPLATLAARSALAIPTRPRSEAARERYDAPAPAGAALAIRSATRLISGIAVRGH